MRRRRRSQAASLIASSESQLFGSISGGSTGLPDLSGLTAAAQAYSLYTNDEECVCGEPPR